jgi:hypothetical protein
MEIRMRILSLSVVLALALAAPAEAQRNNNSKNTPGRGQDAQTTTISFGAIAEREIRSYFQTNPTTSQGSLPPGIAKNLARGKPLPPGIAKRALPAGLAGRLPSYPGHEVIIVDRDVILVNAATQIIVDILTRIF